MCRSPGRRRDYAIDCLTAHHGGESTPRRSPGPPGPSHALIWTGSSTASPLTTAVEAHHPPLSESLARLSRAACGRRVGGGGEDESESEGRGTKTAERWALCISVLPHDKFTIIHNSTKLQVQLTKYKMSRKKQN